MKKGHIILEIKRLVKVIIRIVLVRTNITGKKGNDHLNLVLFKKYGMETDKYIPVGNIHALRFLGGTTK